MYCDFNFFVILSCVFKLSVGSCINSDFNSQKKSCKVKSLCSNNLNNNSIML